MEKQTQLLCDLFAGVPGPDDLIGKAGGRIIEAVMNTTGITPDVLGPIASPREWLARYNIPITEAGPAEMACGKAAAMFRHPSGPGAAGAQVIIPIGYDIDDPKVAWTVWHEIGHAADYIHVRDGKPYHAPEGYYSALHFGIMQQHSEEIINYRQETSSLLHMITSLAPLGVTHAIQLALLFDGKGSVTVTALMRPKKFKADSNDDQDSVDLSGLRTVQVSGTIEEVQAELATHLTSAVAKLVKHTKAIDDLDAVLAAELAEKKAELAKTKTAAVNKSAVKAAATIAAKKAKPATAHADDDAEPPEDDEPSFATAAAITIAGLQPAWKSLKAPARGEAKNPAPVSADVGNFTEDLGEFFKE